MSSTNDPLLPEGQAQGEPAPGFKARMKVQAKKYSGYCCLLLLGLFVLACIFQGLVYSFVTLGCGPSSIGSNYHFPGGGKSAYGGASYNLVPQGSLLSEREKAFWGWPMDVLPANEAGTPSGAQVGTWWRNRGPLFYTYTYEDISNSKLTAYMRSNFWAPWQSHKIARCDGKGPVITFTESGYWIHNKIRRLLRMNQAQTFEIYFGSEKVAEAQEVESGYQSLTITNFTTGEKISSSILTNRHYHGNKDQWYAHSIFESDVPFFVVSAITLPYAYEAATDKDNAVQARPAPSPPPPPEFFLADQVEGVATKAEDASVSKTLAGTVGESTDRHV